MISKELYGDIHKMTATILLGTASFVLVAFLFRDHWDHLRGSHTPFSGEPLHCSVYLALGWAYSMM